MISDRLKTLRENNKLTQSDIATQLGISRSAVNAWELDISVPSTNYIIALSKLYKVSTDYILCIDTKERIDISNLSNRKKEVVYSMLQVLSE